MTASIKLEISIIANMASRNRATRTTLCRDKSSAFFMSLQMHFLWQEGVELIFSVGYVALSVAAEMFSTYQTTTHFAPDLKGILKLHIFTKCIFCCFSG